MFLCITATSDVQRPTATIMPSGTTPLCCCYHNVSVNPFYSLFLQYIKIDGFLFFYGTIWQQKIAKTCKLDQFIQFNSGMINVFKKAVERICQNMLMNMFLDIRFSLFILSTFLAQLRNFSRTTKYKIVNIFDKLALQVK